MIKQTKLSSVTFAIAIPIALQSLVAFAVNMMDTVMLGQLGEVELSASSLANQIFFIVSLAIGGISAGAGIMASHAWGRKDVDRIHNILAYTYRVAIVFLLVTTLAAVCFPTALMKIYTTDAAVIEAGAIYLRIVGISYLFYGITTITTGVLRSVHTVKIAMVASCMSMFLNVFFNWVLIFGNLGMPKMGMAGAAIATVIARVVEFLFIMGFMAFKEDKLRLSIKKLLVTDPTIWKPYIKTSSPVIANEFFWALGESAIAMVLGRMGTEVVAAQSICGVMMQLAGVLIQGISSASCVVVGNAVGAGENESLPHLKRYFQRFALLMGSISSVLVLIALPLTLGLYKVSDAAIGYAWQLIIITAIIQPFQALQITNMTGILRGGGDVRFAMLNDLIFLWCLTVPLGFLGGLVWDLPVWVVFCFLRLEKICKTFTSEYRLRSGKWVHNTSLISANAEEEQSS